MSAASQTSCECGPLGRFLGSTLGKKAVMAVTGVLMFGFVVAHLAGNLQIFAGDGGAKLNAYAHFLRTMPAVLWGARLVLLAALILHIWAAVSLKRLAGQARPVAYKLRKDLKATTSSRTMYWGGISLFFYVIYHLLHFTFGAASPIAQGFRQEQVYQNMVASFQNPVMSGVYILAMGALGMHLFHGLYSLFQTLGFNHPAYMPRIRLGAKVFASVVVLGFVSIPVAVLAGLVK